MKIRCKFRRPHQRPLRVRAFSRDRTDLRRLSAFGVLEPEAAPPFSRMHHLDFAFHFVGLHEAHGLADSVKTEGMLLDPI